MTNAASLPVKEPDPFRFAAVFTLPAAVCASQQVKMIEKRKAIPSEC